MSNTRQGVDVPYLHPHDNRIRRMSISWPIAWRYLRGRRRSGAIQIITGISTFGLAFGTAAILIIMSVFNGFEELLLDMNEQFNPNLMVTPTHGKWIDAADDRIAQIEQIPGVWLVSRTIEDNAVFEHDGRREVGILKGVDGNYLNVTRLDSCITRGEYIDVDSEGYPLFLGIGMSYKLGVNIYDRLTPVYIQTIIQNRNSLISRPIQQVAATPKGSFSVMSDVDYEYVITSLQGAQRLLGRPGQISRLEVGLYPNALARAGSIADQIESIFEDDVIALDRLAQQADTIKVMRVEKWLAFIILLLVIFLVALNLIGAIWMIVLEKKKDLSLLSALGGGATFIRNIILRLGLLICLLGIGFGILIAQGFYYLQLRYELITMGESALVNAYPMVMRSSDYPIVIGMILLIGIIAILLPAMRIGAPSYEALKHG